MKKIAIDLTSLNDNFSGLERYSLEITKQLINLDKINHYVLIFKNEIYPYFKDKQIENVEYYICYGGKLVVNQWKILKAIKKIRPNVIYFPAFPPALLLKKKKKYEIISMIHDLVAWDCGETMKWKSKLLFKFGIKHAIKISKLITVNSEFTKTRVVQKFGNRKNIVIIPCATNIQYIDTSDNYINNTFNFEGKYFLTLGTMEPRKNLGWLMESYIEVLKQDNSLPKLVIVGRNGWKTHFSKYEEYKENIIFTGFVDEKYILDVYTKADAFLFASKYEGFGIPVLEAVRSNTIPIVSKIPSNFELLGEDYSLSFDFKKESFQKVLNEFNSMTKEEVEKLKIDNLKKTEKFNWLDSAKELLNYLK